MGWQESNFGLHQLGLIRYSLIIVRIFVFWDLVVDTFGLL